MKKGNKFLCKQPGAEHRKWNNSSWNSGNAEQTMQRFPGKGAQLRCCLAASSSLSTPQLLSGWHSSSCTFSEIWRRTIYAVICWWPSTILQQRRVLCWLLTRGSSIQQRHGPPGHTPTFPESHTMLKDSFHHFLNEAHWTPETFSLQTISFCQNTS